MVYYNQHISLGKKNPLYTLKTTFRTVPVARTKRASAILGLHGTIAASDLCSMFLHTFSQLLSSKNKRNRRMKTEGGKEKHQKHPNKIRQRQGTNIDNKHKTATGGHITHLTPAAPFYTCVSPLQTKKITRRASWHKTNLLFNLSCRW